MNRLITWRESFFRALPENRRLERIWFIAKTDFKQRYYGSFLGLIWALLNPVFQLLIYYVVFTLVFQSREEKFILFLFLGLIHFLFLAETSSKGMMMFRTKRFLLENIQINRLDVYYANLVAGFLGFLFNLGVFFVIRILTVTTPISESILLYPLLLLNLLLFIHAVSLILSMIWAYFRDVAHIWNIVRTALMWLSGIFFSVDPTPGSNTELFAYLTPLAGILLNIRNITIYDNPINWWMFGYDFAYALLLLAMALLLFNRQSRLALEKM